MEKIGSLILWVIIVPVILFTYTLVMIDVMIEIIEIMKKKFYKFLLSLMGWKVKGRIIPIPSVVLVAPHTSIWDGFIGKIAMDSLGLKYRTISAGWLFFWPFKYIMEHCLGAVPVKPGSNIIFESAKYLKENPDKIVVLCPEGTRKATSKWNPGYYYISKMAKVPITVVGLNYRDKEINILDVINPENLDLPTTKRILKTDYTNKQVVPLHKEGFRLENI